MMSIIDFLLPFFAAFGLASVTYLAVQFISNYIQEKRSDKNRAEEFEKNINEKIINILIDISYLKSRDLLLENNINKIKNRKKTSGKE